MNAVPLQFFGDRQPHFVGSFDEAERKAGVVEPLGPFFLGTR
jgi:hypothetical protein